MTKTSIDLVWIVVTDFKKALKFYTETLGLKALSVSEEAGWAELQGPDGGAMLGIAKHNAHSPITAGKNAVVTLTVPNLESSIADLKRKGAKLVGEIQEVPGHVRLQTLLDQDGNFCQLVETLDAHKKHKGCC